MLFVPIRIQKTELAYSFNQDQKTIICDELNDDILSYLNKDVQNHIINDIPYQFGKLLCIETSSLFGTNKQITYILPIMLLSVRDVSINEDFPWSSILHVAGCTLSNDSLQHIENGLDCTNISAIMTVDGNVSFDSFDKTDAFITVSDKLATLSSDHYEELVVIASQDKEGVPVGSPVNVYTRWNFSVKVRSRVIDCKELSIKYCYQTKE